MVDEDLDIANNFYILDLIALSTTNAIMKDVCGEKYTIGEKLMILNSIETHWNLYFKYKYPLQRKIANDIYILNDLVHIIDITLAVLMENCINGELKFTRNNYEVTINTKNLYPKVDIVDMNAENTDNPF